MPGTDPSTGDRPLALIIDDDADTREMYSMYLQHVGIRVVEADEDPQRALDTAATYLPDVITTDLRLWGNLCQVFKDDDRTRRIPVIAVTGTAMPGDIANAKRAGCVSVLTKPCLPETLVQEIRRVLQSTSHRVTS
jgi:two-component system, cell cycle response regulator DivK